MTCVATDWSKLGIGFLVTQKHCDLPSGKCYPVDCEAFGVVWSLVNARMLTLGCPDLLGTVPHQSLIPILGDWNMPDILNQRLYRFIEKCLRFSSRFSTVLGKLYNITKEEDNISKFNEYDESDTELGATISTAI